MEMKITFDGGKKVNAQLGPHIIRTDQSTKAGGDGSAPEPYTLFLASIGTCAGIYVLGYCQARNIPTDGIELVQTFDFHPVSHRLETVAITIYVPPGFPEEQLKGLRHAAEHCAVKKTILNPPDFQIKTQMIDA